MTAILKKDQKALLLASYCDDCTDDFPCYECLLMNNVMTVREDTPVDIHGGLQYLQEADKDG